jgi:hypothetical protein
MPFGSMPAHRCARAPTNEQQAMTRSRADEPGGEAGAGAGGSGRLKHCPCAASALFPLPPPPALPSLLPAIESSAALLLQRDGSTRQPGADSATGGREPRRGAGAKETPCAFLPLWLCPVLLACAALRLSGTALWSVFSLLFFCRSPKAKQHTQRSAAQSLSFNTHASIRTPTRICAPSSPRLHLPLSRRHERAGPSRDCRSHATRLGCCCCCRSD